MFVHRSRDHRTEDGGTDGATDGGANEWSENNSHVHNLASSESQRPCREVRYDRRTGTITYEGLRDGYVYVTKARGP